MTISWDKPKKLILRSHQSPGDVLMLTAFVRDLCTSFPYKYLVDVRTSCPDLWLNNPYITPLNDKDTDVSILDAEYPLIQKSNRYPYHFIHGYFKYFSEILQENIEPQFFKGDITLSEDETTDDILNRYNLSKDFWIIIAGGKYDFTAKWPNPIYLQKVVDHFKNKISFVQVGAEHHKHFPLNNVTNLIGRTSLREFIQLIYHSSGLICPVTFAMHAAAAIKTKIKTMPNRPAVIIAGGREPSHWEAYPFHRFLSNVGALPCCSKGGCWVSRCQTVGDGDMKDSRHVCKYPEKIQEDLYIPKCINMITPEQIIQSVESYYQGGILSYEQ